MSASGAGPAGQPGNGPGAAGSAAASSARGAGERGAGHGGRRLAAAALALGAVALVTWSVADPRFRGPGGELAASFCLPLAAGAAVALLAWASAAGAVQAGVWAAVALLGQAAALQLVLAGNTVRYQHYMTPGQIALSAPPIVVWLLAFQLAAVVAAGARGRRARRTLAWLVAQLGVWRLLLAAALCALASAALSRRPADYVLEVVLASALQLLALANAGLAVAALPDGVLARIGRWRGFPADEGQAHSGTAPLPGEPDRLAGARADSDAAATPGGPDRFALVLAGCVVLAAALLSLLAYQRFPHIPDEVSYLLQAKYFAHGLLTMPAAPVPAAFNLDLMTYEPGRWYSPFPPGWPAVLALGVRLGIGWLVNPLLGGLSIVLAYMFLRELYPLRTARLATLLLAVSPWQIFLAMSFMSHTLALALALLAALGAARVRRGQAPAWAWVAGAATGMVSLMRPLEGVALAALLGLWLLPARGRRFRFAPVAGLALGALLAGAPALWYNALLTGSPLKFPVMDYFDRLYGPGVNALGFGPNRGLDWQGLHPGRGHSPLGAVVNAAMNTSAIGVELFGWAAGSLFLLLAFTLSRRLRRSDWLMLAAIAVVTGAHAFYWFNGGPDFGARYWYLVIVPCVALTARAIEWLDGAWPRPGAATALALLLILGALVDFVPWRATDRYYHYRGMQPGMQALAQADHFGRSLVLVRGRRHPDYAAAAVLNPVDLRADAPIYTWDRGAAEHAALARAYPDRPVWIVDGPTVTGDGFRIAAGPLPAGSLLQPPAIPAGPPAQPAGAGTRGGGGGGGRATRLYVTSSSRTAP